VINTVDLALVAATKLRNVVLNNRSLVSRVSDVVVYVVANVAPKWLYRQCWRPIQGAESAKLRSVRTSSRVAWSFSPKVWPRIIFPLEVAQLTRVSELPKLKDPRLAVMAMSFDLSGGIYHLHSIASHCKDEEVLSINSPPMLCSQLYLHRVFL